MTAIVIRDDSSRAKAHRLVDYAPVGYEVVSREHKSARNNEQNALYWSCLQEIAEQAEVKGKKFSKDIWHHYYARLFLPMIEIELPGGMHDLTRKTTTKLNVREFSDYLTQIQADAVQELGVRFSAREMV